LPVEKKVYTPMWVAWLITGLMALVLAFTTYLAFATKPEPGEPPPLLVLALVVPVALIALVLVWLSALRKLPTYIIVEEDLP